MVAVLAMQCFIGANVMAAINPAKVPFKAAIARLGDPKYDLSNIEKMDFRNDAPKGGKIRIGTVGTFDSLNMFNVTGIAAEGLAYTHASLMKRSQDEPFTLYCYLAEGVYVAPDFSSVTFKIDPRATFHDGSPITAKDILFTIDLLKEKGWPRYKQYYSKIDRIHVHDDHTLTFYLKLDEKGHFDPELPMILGVLTPLQEKSLKNADFTAMNMTHLVGSGPYKIKQADAGRRIVYERIKNYWAENLPLNKGSSNFDAIEIIYTKNTTTHFQEFLAGNLDIYFEQDPNQWETRYDVPQVHDGRIQKLVMDHQRPVMVRTIAMNMRKPLFSDLRVRQALSLAFDFDTLNAMIFYGKMKRVQSLFANTSLAHHGAVSDLERKLLSPHDTVIKEQMENGELPKDVLDAPYVAPSTEGNGKQRENLQKANELLIQAGWTIQKGKRLNAKGDVMRIEFLIKDPRFEKIALHYQRSLKQLGIELSVRLVDTVQYEARTSNRDFDMIIHAWSNSLSPGIEQSYYFSKKTADIEGSSNYIGIKDDLIESLANAISRAQTREELEAHVHNLDRFVMHKHYMIPLGYMNQSLVAYYKDRIAFPTPDPKIGINIVDNGWALHPNSLEEHAQQSIFAKLWHKVRSILSL